MLVAAPGAKVALIARLAGEATGVKVCSCVRLLSCCRRASSRIMSGVIGIALSICCCTVCGGAAAFYPWLPCAWAQPDDGAAANNKIGRSRGAAKWEDMGAPQR